MHLLISMNSFIVRTTKGLVAVAACLMLSGCSDGYTKFKVVHGTVTVDGQKVEAGRIQFVPVEGTRGPVSFARIVDGRYCIETHGGVPVGKHRVEVDARKKTGRKVLQDIGVVDNAMVDETIPIGAEQYTGVNSPLIVEVLPDSDGCINIEIPVNPARSSRSPR